MDFQVKILEAMRRGREHAESLMVDTVTLWRPTGDFVRVDGKTVPEMVEVWSGPAKVQSRNAYPVTPEAGGRTASLVVLEVHIPASVDVGVMVDDVFIVDSSQDVALSGSRLRVRTDPTRTWRTARRFQVEEVAA